MKIPGEPVAVMAEGRFQREGFSFFAATGPLPGKAKRAACMPEPEDLPGLAVPPPRVLGAPHRKGWGRPPAGFSCLQAQAPGARAPWALGAPSLKSKLLEMR